MTTKGPTTPPGCELHAIDFLAHQLYIQSLNGGIGVLWLTMRDDLQEKWRTPATKLFDDWRQHELERSRQAIGDEIAGLLSQKLPQWGAHEIDSTGRPRPEHTRCQRPPYPEV